MANLAKYIVQLEAQTARYEQKLDQANKKLDRFDKRNKKSLDGLKRAFIGLAGIISVRFFAGYIKSTIESADEMLKLTQRIGGTVEAFSELQHVGDLSGVSMNEMGNALRRMTRRISEAAQGTGEAKNALRELGLDAKRLSEIPIDKQFEIIADALAGVTNESDKVRLAQKLMDAEGARLLSTMKDGAAGIREMRQEARDLGKTLTTDQAQAAERANDAMTRLNASVGSLARNMTLNLVPAIEAVITGWDRLLFDADPFPFEAQIEKTKDRIEQLKQALTSRYEPLFYGQTLSESQSELDALILKLDELKLAQRRAMGLEPGEIPGIQGLDVAIGQELKKIESKHLKLEVKLSPKIDLANIEDLKAGLSNINVDRKKIPVLVKPEIELEDIQKVIDEMDTSFKSFGEGLGDGLQDSFVNAFLGVETSFSDLLKRMAVQAATSQLFTALAALGGPVGTAFSFLGFGGARQHGGPTSSDRSYLVGERGPEIFTPGATGFVTPMAGGVTVNQNIHFDVGLESVDQRITQAAPALARAAQSGVMRAIGRPSMA
jgi:hypothetical protein